MGGECLWRESSKRENDLLIVSGLRGSVNTGRATLMRANDDRGETEMGALFGVLRLKAVLSSLYCACHGSVLLSL